MNAANTNDYNYTQNDLKKTINEEVNILNYIKEKNNKKQINKIEIITKETTANIKENNLNKIISENEYDQLCSKFSNGEDLTLDELRMLRNYETQQKEKNKEESLTQKTMKINPYESRGFTNNNILIYLILLTIFIGIITGYVLYNVTH